LGPLSVSDTRGLWDSAVLPEPFAVTAVTPQVPATRSAAGAAASAAVLTPEGSLRQLATHETVPADPHSSAAESPQLALTHPLADAPMTRAGSAAWKPPTEGGEAALVPYSGASSAEPGARSETGGVESAGTSSEPACSTSAAQATVAAEAHLPLVDVSALPQLASSLSSSWLASGPVRPARSGALSARVIGSAVLGDAFSTHVSYEILVSDGAGARWLVQRRFSNFEVLHKRVKPLRARGRFKLPPKRILHHAPEGGFMDTRKELLDRYLQDMLADPRLAGCAELWDFLSAQSRSYVPAPGGGGVLKSVSQGLSAGIDSAVGRVSTGVHVVRAELADATRKLDRKLEQMKERWADAELLPRDASPAPQQPGAPQPQHERADDAAGSSQLHGSSSMLSLSTAVSGAGAGDDTSSGDDTDSTPVSRAPTDPTVQAPESATLADARVSPEQQPEQPAELSPPPQPSAVAAAAAGRGGSASGAEDPAGLSLPLLDLVDAVFRLHEKGWVQRRMLSFARGVAELFLGGAVDEALASKVAQLRRADTVAGLVRLVRETLWPGGTWYRTRTVEEALAAGREPPPTAPLGFGGVPPGREAEAHNDARAVCALLLERSGSGAVERLIGRDAYRLGTLELYHLLQSPVFVRQIGHNILEALLVRGPCACVPSSSHLCRDLGCLMIAGGHVP
jgi:hypothetical protein